MTAAWKELVKEFWLVHRRDYKMESWWESWLVTLLALVMDSKKDFEKVQRSENGRASS